MKLTKKEVDEVNLKTLLQLRKEFVDLGQGNMVMQLNESIAELARKLHLNYYELN